MEIVRLEAVPARKPLPGLAVFRVLVGWFMLVQSVGGRVTNKVLPVLMMMNTVLCLRPDSGSSILAQLLDSPAKAASIVLVYSFEDEEY